MRRLLTLAEVAERLGASVEWLYRHRKRLATEQGFPAPALGRGMQQRWDPRALELWQDARLKTTNPTLAPTSAPATTEPEDLQVWRELLSERSDAIADPSKH